MKLVVLFLLVGLQANAQDIRSDVSGILGGETSCFAGNGNSIGRGDFTAAEARSIDQAIPCANMTEEGIDGTPGEGSITDFNAGVKIRHVIYSELVRKQIKELNCRANTMALMSQPGGAGHDQTLVMALNKFNQLRPEIQRLKKKAADLLLASNQSAGAAINRNMKAPDLGESIRLENQAADATKELRQLLTHIPFGTEPEVQAALTRLSAGMPKDGTSQDGVAMFESAFFNAVNASSKKYADSQKSLQGLYSTSMYDSRGKKLGGDIREDGDLWRAFGSAQSFEGFATGLKVSANTRKEITCSLDARFKTGNDRMKLIDYTIQGAGLVAAVTTAVFPPAAVVTAPIITVASAYQAAGAVYYVNEAARECSTPSTRYSIVKGNACMDGNALASAEMVQSENSTCGQAAAGAIMSVGGMTLEGLALFRAGKLRRAAELAEDVPRTPKFEEPPPSTTAVKTESEADDIVVTARTKPKKSGARRTPCMTADASPSIWNYIVPRAIAECPHAKEGRDAQASAKDLLSEAKEKWRSGQGTEAMTLLNRSKQQSLIAGRAFAKAGREGQSANAYKSAMENFIDGGDAASAATSRLEAVRELGENPSVAIAELNDSIARTSAAIQRLPIHDASLEQRLARLKETLDKFRSGAQRAVDDFTRSNKPRVPSDIPSTTVAPPRPPPPAPAPKPAPKPQPQPPPQPAPRPQPQPAPRAPAPVTPSTTSPPTTLAARNAVRAEATNARLAHDYDTASSKFRLLAEKPTMADSNYAEAFSTSLRGNGSTARSIAAETANGSSANLNEFMLALEKQKPVRIDSWKYETFSPTQKAAYDKDFENLSGQFRSVLRELDRPEVRNQLYTPQATEFARLLRHYN